MHCRWTDITKDEMVGEKMSARQKIRMPYIDNIRSLCIYSLFIWHTCEVFHCKEGFYIEGTKDFLCT